MVRRIPMRPPITTFVDLDFDSDIQEELALPHCGKRNACGAAAISTRSRPWSAAWRRSAVPARWRFHSGNGSGADARVVVKADNGPVKVKPENPGGTIAPKQDNKVYDAVKGTDGAGAARLQEKLVTTSEEPVDMAAIRRACRRDGHGERCSTGRE